MEPRELAACLVPLATTGWEITLSVDVDTKVMVCGGSCILMDIQQRLQRKNHQAALQARRMNKTARRLLQDKISVLESSYKKQEKLLCRETKSLEQELRSSTETGTSSTTLPNPASVESLNPSACPSDVPDLQDNTPRCGSQCRYHAIASQCRYFPCQRLSTYHSIGYNIRAPNGQSPDPGTSMTFIFHDGVAIEGSGLESSRGIPCLAPSSHVSPRNSIQDRERGLRQLVREMKQRNNQQRPRAWAVNYGSPMSSRQLLKPVVPVSDQELAP